MHALGARNKKENESDDTYTQQNTEHNRYLGNKWMTATHMEVKSGYDHPATLSQLLRKPVYHKIHSTWHRPGPSKGVCDDIPRSSAPVVPPAAKNTRCYPMSRCRQVLSPPA